MDIGIDASGHSERVRGKRLGESGEGEDDERTVDGQKRETERGTTIRLLDYQYDLHEPKHSVALVFVSFLPPLWDFRKGGIGRDCRYLRERSRAGGSVGDFREGCRYRGYGRLDQCLQH